MGFTRSNWPPKTRVIFRGKLHFWYQRIILMNRYFKTRHFVEITYQIFCYKVGTLYIFLFHFFRCFQGKVQNFMKEFLTIRHVPATCYDFGNGSKVLDLKFRNRIMGENQWKNMKTNGMGLVKCWSHENYVKLPKKTYLLKKFVKFKCLEIIYCLKKSESSHWE